MPLIYKIPGYAGNGLLLLLGIVIVATGHAILGIFIGLLAGLNLYLVYKLDQFSREEVWLAHEIQMAKLREELILERQRVSELERAQPAPPSPASPGAADRATDP